MLVSMELARHSTQLGVVEVESKNDAWAIGSTGFDGALGQLVPRKISIDATHLGQKAVILFENTYSWSPSVAISLSGRQETIHVSRVHDAMQRRCAITGADLTLRWADAGTSYSVFRGGNPMASISKITVDEPGIMKFEVSSSKEDIVLAVCIAVAVCLVS